MVVDTPIFIAILFQEKSADACLAELEGHYGSLRMSTVNLTEILILFRSRYPKRFQELGRQVFALACLREKR